MGYNRRTAGIAFGFLLMLAVGCVKQGPPPPPLVETVAVLPFDNESNNIDASLYLQRYVYLALEPSAYRVIPYKEVNEQLREKGIQEGGQLAAMDPVKIGRDLGVHALMFGNVESFKYTNIGVYVSRKVALELKLVDVTTGEILWENKGKMASRRFAVDEKSIKKNFAKGLADQLVDKLYRSPLDEESRIATRKALATLPGFRFSGFAKDEDTSGSVKKGSKNILKGVIQKQ